MRPNVVGVVIVERSGRGWIFFVEEFAGNVLGLHCADPSDVVVLREYS
jgi:hypothetical protein